MDSMRRDHVKNYPFQYSARMDQNLGQGRNNTPTIQIVRLGCRL